MFPAQLAKEDPPSDGLAVIAVGANTAAGTAASFRSGRKLGQVPVGR